MIEPAIRVAGPEDCAVIGQMLDAFNREYDDPTPGPAQLERRLARHDPSVDRTASGDTTVPTILGP